LERSVRTLNRPSGTFSRREKADHVRIEARASASILCIAYWQVRVVNDVNRVKFPLPAAYPAAVGVHAKLSALLPVNVTVALPHFVAAVPAFAYAGGNCAPPPLT